MRLFSLPSRNTSSRSIISEKMKEKKARASQENGSGSMSAEGQRIPKCLPAPQVAWAPPAPHLFLCVREVSRPALHVPFLLFCVRCLPHTWRKPLRPQGTRSAVSSLCTSPALSTPRSLAILFRHQCELLSSETPPWFPVSPRVRTKPSPIPLAPRAHQPSHWLFPLPAHSSQVPHGSIATCLLGRQPCPPPGLIQCTEHPVPVSCCVFYMASVPS